MNKIKQILIYIGLIFLVINSVNGFTVYFEEGDIINAVGGKYVYELTFIIDNTDPADYISDESEISFVQVKSASTNSNLIRIINENSYKNVGVFVDKDVIEKVKIEFRLPRTEEINNEYNISMVAYTDDNRQRIATSIIKPSKISENLISSLSTKELMYYGFLGLIIIILFVIFYDYIYNKKGKKRY